MGKFAISTKELTRDARVTSDIFPPSARRVRSFSLSRRTKRYRDPTASRSFIFRSAALWVAAVSRPLSPPSSSISAADVGIVEEVCFDRIKCNFRLSLLVRSACQRNQFHVTNSALMREKKRRFLHSSSDTTYFYSRTSFVFEVAYLRDDWGYCNINSRV
jgi:hypothetical protein